MNKKVFLSTVLGVLQSFNGLSGLLGGYMLINDPTGITLSMKLEWLQKTPFPNFLIPGVILFLFIGVGNILGLWITLKKKKNRALFGLIFGFILMVWIISQVTWIGYKDFLQPLYFSLGLIQAVAGLALSRNSS